MTLLRVSLSLFTVAIFAVTLTAAGNAGFNWPRAFLSDVFALQWAAQFNTDLLIHLVLLGRLGGVAGGPQCPGPALRRLLRGVGRDVQLPVSAGGQLSRQRRRGSRAARRTRPACTDFKLS